MSRIKNILFGKIAVSTKFITDEQLDECLQEQIEMETRGEKAPRLGELLERKGYLTKRQIRSLLETMQSMQRRLFGEIATSFQFVTLDQVQTCLEIQRYLKEPQENVPLFGQALATYRGHAQQVTDGAEPAKIGELMVAMGFLKEHQVKAVIEEQNKKIVECENCEASLNVTNFLPGQKVKCGQCQSVLMIQQTAMGDLEAVVPRDAEEEQLPSGDEQVESFAEGTEPLELSGDEGGDGQPAEAPAPDDLALHKDEAADSDLRLVKPITLGDFRVISKLGQDSTGTLYKAEQLSKHRIVVLKLMNKSTMGESDFSSRFVAEAKKVAGLDHKSLKRIYSLGKIGERYFVAQEFVEGESVHKLLERESRIPYARAIQIVLKVAEALDYGCKKGVFHHDLRPSNILVLQNGSVKLAQLGLATKSTENILAISKSGALAPFYIAPEIVTEDRSLDHRTDIYSLGAILFHMITGRPPYQGSSPFEILVRLTEETIPPLKFFDPSIPDPICSIVERMLQAEPEERYQNYAELLNDMRAAASLAATYGGEIPKDMEEGIVKSRRFTPLAMPSPEGSERPTAKVPEVDGEEVSTQRVPESRVAAAKNVVKAEAEAKGRGGRSVMSFDPKLFLVGVAVIALAVGGYKYFGKGDPPIVVTNGVIPAGMDPFDGLQAQLSAVPGNHPEIARLCHDFLAQYPQHARAAEAKATGDASQKELDALLTVALEQLDTEVSGMLAGMQYESAVNRWVENLPEALMGDDRKPMLEERRKATREKVNVAVQAEIGKAWTSAKAGEYDTARSALDGLVSQLGKLEELVAQVAAEKGKIDAHQKQTTAAADAKAAEERGKKANEYCNQVAKMISIASRSLNFTDVSTKVTGADATVFEGGQHLDRWNELKATIDLLAGFKQRMIEKVSAHISSLVNNENFTQNPVVQLSLDGKTTKVLVTGASDNGLDVLIAPGRPPKQVPWTDVPPMVVYDLARDLATDSGNADHHVALGTYAMYRELYRQAESAFNRAVVAEPTRKESLERHYVTLTDVFNKRAEGCCKDCETAIAAGDWNKAVACMLAVLNEYSDTDYYGKNRAQIDSTIEKLFKDLAGPKGRLSTFAGPDLGRWKPSGDGKWTVKQGALLTEGGKSHKIEGEDKGVEDLAFFMRLNQDDGTKLTVKVGDYKLALEFASNKANANKGTELKTGQAFLRVGDWHSIRFVRAVESGQEWLRISTDGQTLYEFKGAAGRDGILIEISSRKANNLEIDNLAVKATGQ